MTSSYRAPAGEATAELREKGSRFLAIVCPVASPDESASRLLALRETYRDATHVCWAWRVGAPDSRGRGSARERSSDDGEPSGTAGLPILRSIAGLGASDTLVAVVRWYGGTKLGKGGLVRAYGGAAREALAEVVWQERFVVRRFAVIFAYDQSGDVDRLLRPPAIQLVRATYGEDIRGELLVREGQEGSVLGELDRLRIQWTELPESS